LDLLVNNAAVGGPVGPVSQIDHEDWWRCLEISLRGPMLCTRLILPGMLQRRRGRIVNGGQRRARSQGDLLPFGMILQG
jgi:NAD(P)-dependent dehydrogenase (short-subunit alcohol dehydrogenase family)